MKDSDPNHRKAIFRVYYPPHLLPKIFGCIAFKSLGTPSYLIKSHIIALYFESWVSSTWGRAEKRTQTPTLPKRFSGYIIPILYLLSKMMGSIVIISLTYCSFPSKIRI